jgi:hypothetical protein
MSINKKIIKYIFNLVLIKKLTKFNRADVYRSGKFYGCPAKPKDIWGEKNGGNPDYSSSCQPINK